MLLNTLSSDAMPRCFLHVGKANVRPVFSPGKDLGLLVPSSAMWESAPLCLLLFLVFFGARFLPDTSFSLERKFTQKHFLCGFAKV